MGRPKKIIKKTCRRWTQEEKDYVADVWGIKTVKQIARKINRTEGAVVSFAEKNKLGSMYRAEWLTTNQAAKIIGVNQKTIISWIKEYGLKAESKALLERMMYRIDIMEFYKFLKNNQNRWKATNLPYLALGYEELWLEEKRKLDTSNDLIKKSRSMWTIKEELTLIKMLNEGYSYKEIAMSLNRTIPAVKRYTYRLEKKKKIISRNERLKKAC